MQHRSILWETPFGIQRARPQGGHTSLRTHILVLHALKVKHRSTDSTFALQAFVLALVQALLSVSLFLSL